MEKSRILFVTQEITPFLNETSLAETVRKLSQGVHEKDKEGYQLGYIERP